MRSIVTGIKTSAWVSIGLVLVLGSLQLEAAVGPDSPETPRGQFPPSPQQSPLSPQPFPERPPQPLEPQPFPYE
jgi:hypothetical protein